MKPHLRHNKNCLNCGSHVEERFCSHCGQENAETKESFGHLVSHFFSDLTHYDSKLFTTLKDLLLKPGFLTKEYLAGKRTSYLHPIRMYVFVSFLYFLVILSFNNLEHQTEEAIADTASQNTRQQITDSLRLMLSSGHRSSVSASIRDSVVKEAIAKINTDSISPRDMFYIFNVSYRDLVTFDSAQKLLPEQQRQKGLKTWLYHHWLNTMNLYGKKGSILLASNRTKHFVPKLMFLLLPLFALLLKLFYSSKKYFYSEHLIFSLHFHTATFLLFLFFAILGLLFPAFSNDAVNISYLMALIYLGMALRKVYGQTAWITFFKVLGLSVLYGIFILAGYVILAASSLL